MRWVESVIALIGCSTRYTLPVRAVAVIPSYQVESTIAETVQALLSDDRIAEVIVVNDASTDDTAARAGSAGARVINLPRNLGMGGAIEAGFDAAKDATAILIVDGDTAESSRAAIDLVGPILRDEADVVIGVLPSAGSQGGFGAVKRTAGWLIYRASGFRSQSPLSGQRAVRPSVFEACRPLAPRFGANPAFTADAARHGFRIVEQPVEMTHSHRGRSISGFAHRARQGWDLLRALIPRVLARAAKQRT